MSLTSRQARLLTVAGIAAAGLSGVAATGAQAASKTLTYSCTYPLIGAQPLSVAIDAALPSSVPSGSATPQYDVTATATAGADTKSGLDLIGAKSISGTAKAGATVSGVGAAQSVSVPVTVTPYTVDPSATDLVLTATGKTPSLTFPSSGTATVKVDTLALNLTAKDADGTPIALGTTSDSDGDANTFDVPCTLDPTTQDTTLGTFTVS
ncbi:MAG: DUF6801 domain-containing protein [Solirubrobacteraceae bacterium]